MRALAVAALLLVGCATETTQPTGVSPDAGTSADDAASDSLPAPPSGALRVASLNVHLLFDSVCDSGKCGTGDFEAVATEAEIASRVTRIADHLRYLDADVIMLQEVETQALLDAIAAKMPGYPTHVVGEIGLPASVDVGVLSRFPTLEVKTHRDQTLVRPDGTTTTFTREFLEVHLDRGGSRVIAFAAHFRSKNNDDPGRRYAEAVAARDIVAQAALDNPMALVVMGGDLNDVPGSSPINALEEKLSRVSAGLPNADIATYWYSGDGQAIDHLFVPSRSRIVDGTFAVARDPGVHTFAGSDHAAVHADFE